MQEDKNIIHFVILMFLVVVMSIAGLFGRELWTPDEPREAAISLEMAKEKNFLLPKLAGTYFVEKPPLFYIIGSLTIKFFGGIIGNTSALKLIPLTTGMLTLLVMFLLARSFFEFKEAFLSTIILASLPGFIHITHWLLTDGPLMLFVLLAVYLITKSYITQKWSLLPFAAIATGLGFWTKGIIAIVFVGLAWIGIIIAHFTKYGSKNIFSGGSLLWHIASLILLLAGIMSWPMLLMKLYGKELFMEWFWNNHIGRFTGSARQLGHINYNPLYYVGICIVYVLPFFCHFAVGIITLLKKGIRQFSYLDWLIATWGLGGFLILSLSSTKREIYLAPLLPAYALLIVCTIKESADRLCKRWSKIIESIIFLILLTVPIVLLVFREKMLAIFAIGILLLYIILLFKAKSNLTFSLEERYLTKWFLAVITILCFITPILNRFKDYKPHFMEFSKHIETIKERCVLWKPDETTRACFYYYAGLTFPVINELKELKTVLSDDSFFVIALNRSFPPVDNSANLPKWQVIYEKSFGAKHKPRKLMLIQGKKEN